ncbi:MAG: hypothetical protein F6K61_11245 [Sphaerospermopsis sp. SIO1G1]|nr:hypothetical protein [Sphaerospermopsis sp. SIO1G1]
MTKLALIKDLRKKGDAAIVIAKSMGELLAQAILNSGNNKSINYADLNKQIDKLIQKANNITNRTKSILLEATKSIVHDLRYGQQFDIENIPQKIIERYMQKAYISEFEGKIPLISDHHTKVDNLTLTTRMEELRRDIFEQISKWAEKANLDESVAKLRRSRQEPPKDIDLEENLVI